MGNENLPTPGAFVTDNIVQIYATSIDQIIVDMGRQVKLFLDPTETECPNCGVGVDGKSNGIYDSSNPNPIGALHRPSPNQSTCPVCKGRHILLTENSISYTSTIVRSPKDIDYTQYGENITPDNVFKTKMKLVAFEDIKRAKKALIDGEMCKKLRHPIKTGLRDLRYCQGWWIRING